MTTLRHIYLATISYRPDLLEESAAHVPLGIVLGASVKGHHIVTMTARKKLGEPEMAKLDPIARELIESPFVFLDKALRDALTRATNAEDALRCFAQDNAFSVFVSPPEHRTVKRKVQNTVMAAIRDFAKSAYEMHMAGLDPRDTVMHVPADTASVRKKAASRTSGSVSIAEFYPSTRTWDEPRRSLG